MKESIFNSLFESQQHLFAELAQTWKTTTGATLTVIAENECNSFINAHKEKEQAQWIEPLYINGERVGWLMLADTCDHTLQTRLKTDAKVVSTLLQQEYEIEKMTSELIDQQDQLMALHHLAQATRVQSDFQQTLSALAAIAARLLKTEGAFMKLWVAGQEPCFAAFPRETWAMGIWQRLLENFDTDSEQKQWLLQHDDPILKKLGVPIRNLLMKKVQVRSEVVFVIGVVNKLNSDFLTPDIKLLSTITEPAGANLENALLQRDLLNQTRIQTEMEMAKQVQLRLLPRQAPQVTGVDLAVQSRPAFQVGGDFYDFVFDNSGLLTAVVGDVSGKGMPAALLMTMMRTVLRGKTLEIAAAAPEQILDCANRHLYSDFSEVNMFATVFLCQYNVHKHELYYANQGHSPVIFRPANGKARLLQADAPPLGVLPESLAERHLIKLKSGDLLVIGSDGFSEAEKSTGEMFGYDRLLQVIDELAPLPAAEISAQLFKQIHDFAEGHPQSDDQTMLVLKREEQKGKK